MLSSWERVFSYHQNHSEHFRYKRLPSGQLVPTKVIKKRVARTEVRGTLDSLF